MRQTTINTHYQKNMALLTDLYQLTMAYGYWKTEMADWESVFHLFFRRHPFQGGYTIAAGLEAAISFLNSFRFDEDDIDYLRGLKGADNRPLFEEGFLLYLKEMELSCDVDAIPEGTVVFPYEPLVRVRGPLIQCQLLETALLNCINFPTLIASKAARVCQAAEGDPVLEFGLRRAQGADGALTASRAAFIGGCTATSNVLAGKLFDIPVKGTHAHSWVMVFDSEEESFQRYAEAMPSNCVFLVDTYNTLSGVRKAIEVGHWLKERGQRLLGVRLDSGDLAYLSKQARTLLDEAGLDDCEIVASNELDEHVIQELKQQGACIGMWGVGTSLVTGGTQPALDGVYKISAIRRPGEGWQYRLKLSEQMTKISNPGILQVRRYRTDEGALADVVYDVASDVSDGCVVVDPIDSTRRKTIPSGIDSHDLLQEIFKKGRLVYQSPELPQIQQRVRDSLASFHGGVKRFLNPHQYVVGMEQSLYDLKVHLINEIRRNEDTHPS